MNLKTLEKIMYHPKRTQEERIILSRLYENIPIYQRDWEKVKHLLADKDD